MSHRSNYRTLPGTAGKKLRRLTPSRLRCKAEREARLAAESLPPPPGSTPRHGPPVQRRTPNKEQHTP